AGKLRHREKYQGLSRPLLSRPVEDRLRAAAHLTYRRPRQSDRTTLSLRDNQDQKMLAIPVAQRNPPLAAAAGILILIDARLSPRSSRYN
ncbi:MAG: hypothetical protein OXF79_15285, partial [Chloroflexi bacterium]|nr:hypothetical protein [Chloroflexota bacterium]